ncbi:thiamine pyrophosphate-dependent dehydrogenase E1 component subunit alpha [soil metagenome]
MIDDLRTLYRLMMRIREFDSRMQVLVTAGFIRGGAHPAIGQEAVAVGVCAALDTGDLITSTHRGHGHAIAKGVDVRPMMAELFGREGGSCRGRGGSMHIADLSVGMLGANGVVGAGIGIATGAALAQRLTASGRVVVCFFGEGAMNQGALLENVNYAALHKLPIVYVCENNQFAMSMRAERATALTHLSDRALGLGLPGATVDGMDVAAVRDATRRAVERARTGHGPTLLVAECYRLEGHHIGDPLNYRTSEEVQRWRDRDPLARCRLKLATEIGEAEVARIDAEEKARVDDAIAFAEMSPLPQAASAEDDVYA